MILIGDEIVPYETIEKIKNKDDILKTKPNSTLLFEYNSSLMQFCAKNSISFAVVVNNIKEVIYSNALNAKYIVCEKELSKKAQTIAQNYLFDSKVLAIIFNNDELEEIANSEIDGVIYKELLA